MREQIMKMKDYFPFLLFLFMFLSVKKKMKAWNGILQARINTLSKIVEQQILLRIYHIKYQCIRRNYVA